MNANALIRILDHKVALVLKAGLVRIINHQPFRRYFLSHLRFAYVVTETLIHGYRNAGRIHSSNRAHLTIVHSPTDQQGDLERFFLDMVTAIAERPDCPYIDLFLLMNESRSHSEYVAVARLFGRHMNIQILFDEQHLLPLMKTTGGVFPALKGHEAKAVAASAGNLRSRSAHKNAAREYLKTVDATMLFCAVSMPDTLASREIFDALQKITERYRNWGFVILGDCYEALRAGEVPKSLLLPIRSGLDFSTCVGIAAEIDAFIGTADVYGLTAFFSGKPVQFFDCDGYPGRRELLTDDLWSRNPSGGEFERQLQRLLERADLCTTDASATATKAVTLSF